MHFDNGGCIGTKGINDVARSKYFCRQIENIVVAILRSSTSTYHKSKTPPSNFHKSQRSDPCACRYSAEDYYVGGKRGEHKHH